MKYLLTFVRDNKVPAPLIHSQWWVDRLPELERALAAFKGSEVAIVLPTGYMANLAAIRVLANRGDVVLPIEVDALMKPIFNTTAEFRLVTN